MNKKILYMLLLSCMLVFSVFAGCTQSESDAVEAVREMVAELPGVEEFQQLDADAQLESYNATQAAYDAYMALSEAEQARLKDELAAMETLFEYFNTLIMPIG